LTGHETDAGREPRRLVLQAGLDRAKSAAERNRLGQFATPGPLAEAVAAETLALLPPSLPVRFLDPGFGTGAFLAALRAVCGQRPIAAATGYEIDRHYGAPAQALWAGSGLDLRLEDFTAAEPPSGDHPRFTLLLCNPPYVRHHHIGTETKARLRARAAALGLEASGLTGLYGWFLLLADPWLAAGGVAAWLVPAEFLDVNYGTALKRYLCQRVTLLRLHRFAPESVQFGDALVSSAVVWLRQAPPPPGHTVEFSTGPDLARPEERRSVPLAALLPAAKWSRGFEAADRAAADGPRLGELFTIRRGLATGGNRFFILDPARVAELGLPPELVRPLLPGPRRLEGDEILADADGLPRLARPQFLLDCRLEESVLRRRHPALWAYLERGRASVGAGYLCRHRNPWYAQEQRPPTPFLCTYMGRRAQDGSGTPFRFLLNHSRATATNVYLLLYPRPGLQSALERQPGLSHALWQGLRALTAEALTGGGRVYGGGLHKLEPRELAAMPAGPLAALLEPMVKNRFDPG
jgi:hypothetical protein